MLFNCSWNFRLFLLEDFSSVYVIIVDLLNFYLAFIIIDPIIAPEAVILLTAAEEGAVLAGFERRVD